MNDDDMVRPWRNLYYYYKKANYSDSENHRSFKAWTGVLPNVAEKIFIKYLNEEFLPNRSRLLILLNYMKAMPTEDEGAASFQITRKTYRKYVWESIYYLECSMNEILLENRFLDAIPRDGLFKDISLIVDGTDCPINRPSTREERELYSNGRLKENISSRYNVKYTIACQISTGRICFVDGPDPGSFADVTSLKECGIFQSLDGMEILLCDKGYQGHPRCLTPFKKERETLYLNPDEAAFNEVLSSVRILIERVIGRVRVFGALGSRGRFHCHNLRKHKSLFNVACQVTNVSLEVEPLLYESNFYLY